MTDYNCTTTTNGTETNSNPVANFYLVALWSVSGSLYFLGEALRKGGAVNRFFVLPLVSMLCAVSFIFIDLNLLFVTGLCDDVRRRLMVAEYALDTPSSIALDLAYFFRLRVVIDAAKDTGSISPLLDKLSYLLLVVPLSWPACDILSIVSLYHDNLGNMAGGKFAQYVIGAWNIALALNDLVMHFGFLIFILKLAATATVKMKRRLIVVAILLSSNSFGLMAGAIWNFFNAQVGTILIYSFWLNNTFVFLILNKTVGMALKRTPSSTSKTGSGRTK
eukprot:TRINITY_DN10393_c0_g1_i1.p1 TRINITY_DN10393_c0_g1~~TRINITY_DN10393_c0_g1_i1.p1  ORF type:complete len:277 (-),score=34.23 TRINITY_DN10393_c0_g1_i1:388-1218(-)